MYRRSPVIILAAIASLVVVSACGTGGKESATLGSGTNTFGLSEYAIAAPTNDLEAGRISLTANNVGGEEHELVIVRAADVTSLPTKADGSVDESALPDSAKVGEIEHVAAQTKKTESFELTPGHYVAFCNIVDSMMRSSTSMMNGKSPMGDMHDSGMGHVHFALGMSVAFSVR